VTKCHLCEVVEPVVQLVLSVMQIMGQMLQIRLIKNHQRGFTSVSCLGWWAPYHKIHAYMDPSTRRQQATFVGGPSQGCMPHVIQQVMLSPSHQDPPKHIVICKIGKTAVLIHSNRNQFGDIKESDRSQ
jgi:hypothetical protein